MSLPEPPAEPKQSVFAVPAHISAITLSDGCRETHFPINGAVDCERCAEAVKGFIFPPDPNAPAQEQPATNAGDQPSPPAVDAPAPAAAAPAPDAPAKSKKSSSDDGPQPA